MVWCNHHIREIPSNLRFPPGAWFVTKSTATTTTQNDANWNDKEQLHFSTTKPTDPKAWFDHIHYVLQFGYLLLFPRHVFLISSASNHLSTPGF